MSSDVSGRLALLERPDESGHAVLQAMQLGVIEGLQQVAHQLRAKVLEALDDLRVPGR